MVQPPAAAPAPMNEPPPYREHLGQNRQYWRDMILGANDGLVSIFLLVAGVVGGGMPAQDVLLAAIAASLAGAISMAAGEYMATKSQDEVFLAEMDLEREHLRHYREHEIAELRAMFAELGLDGDLLEASVERVGGDEEALLKTMMALEFGFVERERRSPVRAMVMAGGLFVAGALPASLPFAFVTETGTGLAWAALGSGIGLLAVGAFKTVATRRHPVRAALENFLVATAGAVLAYAVGSAYQRLI